MSCGRQKRVDIPLYRGKPRGKAIINPDEQLRNDQKQSGKKSRRYPKDCVVYFYGEILDEAKKRYSVDLMEKNWWGWLYVAELGSSRVGMMRFGIGDSLAGLSLEMLIVKGARNVIVVGAAGGIQKTCGIGDVILVTKAIRGEGVSYHYERAGRYSFPSAQLNIQIEGALERMQTPYRKGPTWTTDAPFRETFAEIRGFQKEGVLCVEQEAAALFSIAKYRRISLSALLFISDDVSGRKWNPQFNTPKYDVGRNAALEAAMETFLGPTSGK